MAASARAVVISPHLDDAVLSASMRLAVGDAQVVTIFAGVPELGAPALWDRMTRATEANRRMRERYAEDDLALARLGSVPTVRFDELDEEYRQVEADVDRIAVLLADCFDGAGEIWLPSAVGGNRDHIAVRAAALQALAAAPAAAVYVYADFPYVIRAGGWPHWVTGMDPEPYLDVAVWVEAQLQKTGLPLDRLEPMVRVLEDAERERKRYAIEAYATQLPALGLGPSRLDAEPEILGYELAWRLEKGRGSPCAGKGRRA